MMMSEDLLEILVCPKCHEKVVPAPEGNALDCRTCKLRYPVLDRIPVMLIDEAQPLGSPSPTDQ